MGVYTNYIKKLEFDLKDVSVFDTPVIPKCSIVILVKNCENKIEKCLKHLIQQSYKDFEIIILDNSEDFTSGVINAFKFDSRIKWIKVREQGLDFNIKEAIKFVSTNKLLVISPNNYLKKHSLNHFVDNKNLKDLPLINYYRKLGFYEFIRSV